MPMPRDRRWRRWMPSSRRTRCGRQRRPRRVHGVSALRIKLAEALNALDLAEVKFDNGMISTKDMNDAYLAVVKTLLLS